MIGHNHLGKNGRFGNQMFQYAATRGIAAKHNYDWCIPDGPKTDEEFEDEENQHKLFMAFKMGGAQEQSTCTLLHTNKRVVLHLIRIYLTTARIISIYMDTFNPKNISSISKMK